MRTLGLLALAWQEQGSVPAAGGLGGNVADLIARSTLASQIILLILAIFSVVSWGVILHKFWQFRRASRQSATFLDVFRRSSKFSEVQAVCRSLVESPLVPIFQAGYAELNTQLRTPQGNPGESRPGSAAPRPTLKSVDAVDRALVRAATAEVNRLERRIPFLATTASITPFIGLLGTVWGVMGAFEGIGQTGSTNISVVAPGIAEALIATAAGLFAAIPAVYFYNQHTQRVKLFVSEMEDFSLEFMNIAERNFT